MCKIHIQTFLSGSKPNLNYKRDDTAVTCFLRHYPSLERTHICKNHNKSPLLAYCIDTL